MIVPDSEDDRLLRSIDTFVETIYWSEEPITFEEALAQAIEDWVAVAAADHNESQPFLETSSEDGVGSALVHLAAAVDTLAGRVESEITMATALCHATTDWIAGAS